MHLCGDHARRHQLIAMRMAKWIQLAQLLILHFVDFIVCPGVTQPSTWVFTQRKRVVSSDWQIGFCFARNWRNTADQRFRLPLKPGLKRLCAIFDQLPLNHFMTHSHLQHEASPRGTSRQEINFVSVEFYLSHSAASFVIERFIPARKRRVAGVAKLVDAPDLGSGAARRGGSSPSTRTKIVV